MNSRRANLPRPRCSGADRGERPGMVVDNMLNITVPPCLVWDLTSAISEQFRSMRPRRRVRWQTKANIKVSHIVFCMPKRSTNWALIFNWWAIAIRRRVSTPFPTPCINIWMATNLMTVMMKIRRCGRVITICFTPNVANCRSISPSN